MRAVLFSISSSILFSCSQWQNQVLSVDAPEKHNAYVVPVPAEKRWNNGVITDFSKESSQWKISHPSKIGGTQKDSVWALLLNNVGTEYEDLSLTFPPTSFANIKHLSLFAAADGFVPVSIRMDITDKNGFSTNFKLSTVKIVPSEGFYEYKFNYNGKYIQSWPTSQKVDSSNIVMIKMNFNPPTSTNSSPYTGELQFKKLTFKTFPPKDNK